MGGPYATGIEATTRPMRFVELARREPDEGLVYVPDVCGAFWWAQLHSWAQNIHDWGCPKCGAWAIHAARALHDMVNVHLKKKPHHPRDLVKFAGEAHQAVHAAGLKCPVCGAMRQAGGYVGDMARTLDTAFLRKALVSGRVKSPSFRSSIAPPIISERATALLSPASCNATAAGKWAASHCNSSRADILSARNSSILAMYSSCMAQLPGRIVSASSLREVFNNSQIPTMIRSGRLRPRVPFDYDRRLSNMTTRRRGWPRGTRSQRITYVDENGRFVVTVHRFRTPDGSLAPGTMLDPKKMRVGDEIWQVETDVLLEQLLEEVMSDSVYHDAMLLELAQRRRVRPDDRQLALIPPDPPPPSPRASEPIGVTPQPAADPDVRPGFKLFRFQEEGARWLADKSRALMADEMGVGKTATAIAWGKDRRPCLVIVPASLVLNWAEKELKTNWRRRDSVLVLDGQNELPSTLPDWVVLSYGQVGHYLGQLRRAGFQTLILDEAHYIRNLEAQRTQDVLDIVDPLDPLPTDRPPRFRLIVTGTPIVNGVMDLFPFLVILGLHRDQTADHDLVRQGQFRLLKHLFDGDDAHETVPGIHHIDITDGLEVPGLFQEQTLDVGHGGLRGNHRHVDGHHPPGRLRRIK